MSSSESAASRRSVVRTAAWSVPVISVAATAPAFAASPAGASTWTWNTPVKWSEQNTKHVSWDFRLVNGSVAINEISIAFTYVPNGGGTFEASTFEIRQFNVIPDASWTKSPSSGPTATISGTRTTDIAAGTTTNIHVDFAGADNSAGTVSATATITYVGSTVTRQLATGNVAWASGTAHTGH